VIRPARTVIIVVWVAAALCAAATIGLIIKGNNKPAAARLLPVKEVTPAIMSAAADKSATYTKIPLGVVKAGILPHHMLVAPMIAGFFDGLAE
jgi:hypothetical protein